MAKTISNIPAVENFIVEEGGANLAKKWNIWKEDFTLYLDATGVTQDTQKKALLLHLGGKDIKSIYRTLKKTEDKYGDVVKSLDDYFEPKKNLTYERYVFKQAKQTKEETTASYITRLKNTCRKL